MSIRIAMWSGPRNISTALLRSWENRPDTFVCDEPLYAHYLKRTGRTDHPGFSDTIGAQESDLKRVISWLSGPIPDDKSIFYQKQMAHHILPRMEIDWTEKMINCFLIRDPRETLLSLIEFLPEPEIDDTGLSQQVSLFERVAAKSNKVPPVLDARDVLQDPRGILCTLCDRIGVSFREEMLEWPAGTRESDGAWAPYWYAKVFETTRFGPYQLKNGKLPKRLEPLLSESYPLYERLYAHRLIV